MLRLDLCVIGGSEPINNINFRCACDRSYCFAYRVALGYTGLHPRSYREDCRALYVPFSHLNFWFEIVALKIIRKYSYTPFTSCTTPKTLYSKHYLHKRFKLLDHILFFYFYFYFFLQTNHAP